MATDSQRKVVYTIIEREAGEGRDAKSFWVRIGSAFVNRDGSWNVKLDALPVNGTMQIRDPEPKDETAGSADRGDARDAPRTSGSGSNRSGRGFGGRR